MIREPAFEHPASLKSLMQRAAARLAARERLPDLELAMIIEEAAAGFALAETEHRAEWLLPWEEAQARSSPAC